MTIYNWLSAQFAALIYGGVPCLMIRILRVDGKSVIEQPPLVQVLFFVTVCFLIFVCLRVFKICNTVKQPKSFSDSLKVAILSPLYKPKATEE